MNMLTIFHPVLALGFWTFLVLLLIPFARFRAAARHEVRPGDFKYGESDTVPAYVRIPNRNYMNLLELPLLFYVVCLLLFVTHGVNAMALTLAWIYVALRMTHSVIHLSYNHVMHRLAAFAASNVVLVALWVVSALHLLALPK